MASGAQRINSSSIDVVDLRDFQRELRAIDKAWPRQLRVANKKAAEPVAKDAKARFAAQPGLGPATGAGLQVQAQQREASIVVGKTQTRNGSAIILGTEFGGSTDPKYKTAKGGHTTQFPPHRGKQGIALFPAIRENREEIIDAYGDMIDELARAAFPH